MAVETKVETDDDLDMDPTVPSRQLAAMRFVTENPAKKDTDEIHRTFRRLMIGNRKEFSKQLGQLEKEFREGLRAAPKKEEEEQADDGVAELLERLLRDKPWLK